MRPTSHQEKKEKKKKVSDKRRNRKNPDQVAILQAEYEKDPNWGKKMITRLSKKSGLSEAQVYKWNWD